MLKRVWAICNKCGHMTCTFTGPLGQQRVSLRCTNEASNCMTQVYYCCLVSGIWSAN
jgi:hypothetical protein